MTEQKPLKKDSTKTVKSRTGKTIFGHFFFEWLHIPKLFRVTLRMIRDYTKSLGELKQAYEKQHVGDKPSIKLEYEQLLISTEEKRRHLDLNVSKLYNWFALNALILFLLVVGFMTLYFYKKVPKTQISVEVSTSYVRFIPTGSVHLEKNDTVFPLASNRYIAVDEAYVSKDYPFADSVPVGIKFGSRRGESRVQLDHLKIGDSSTVTLSAPLHSQLYLDFSGTKLISADISGKKGYVYDNDETDSSALVSGLAVHIEHLLSRDVSFGITLNGATDFEWQPIYLSKMGFLEKRDELNQFGVVTGSIKLLDTDHDSITLKKADFFELEFTEEPVKVFISYKEGLIHLRFDAEVTHLIAGPDLLRREDTNNRMPRRWKTLVDFQGIIITLVAAVGTFLFTLFFRPRRSI